METLYNIEGAKLTALELSLLAHVAGDEGGVWELAAEEAEDVREQLDHLVLEGLLERDCDHAGWLNVWRIPEEGWDTIGPHVENINHIIDNICEA
jgi:hypothetical protein